MHICTTNMGKVREFGGLLAPLGIRLVPTTNHDVPETGSTFVDNAREKAQGYALLYPGEWLLSEDSGLVIPELGGLPGPWSARFDDLDVDTLTCADSKRVRAEMDIANNHRVIKLMTDVPDHQRGAYFVAVATVTGPDGVVAFEVEQRTYGRILRAPRGTNGFGYDPIFESDTTFGSSWAEVDSARKSLISHRSKAAWDLMAWLASTKCSVT